MQAKPLAKRIKLAENFSAVQSLDELKALIDMLYNADRVLGFDIETGYSGAPFAERAVNVFHPSQYVVGFSITNDPTWARYVPLKHDFANNLDPNLAWEIVKPLLEDKVGVAHNILFEAENLRALDLKGDGPSITIPVGKWFDSIIEAYVLSDVPNMPVCGDQLDGGLVRSYIPEFHRTADDYQRSDINSFSIALKELTLFRYNYHQAEIHTLFARDKPLTAKEKKLIRFNTLPVDHKVIHYACDDAYLCLQLHNDQYEKILEDPFLPNVYNLEMQIAEILVDMRMTGIAVDWDGIDRELSVFKSFLHNMQVATRRKFEEEVGRDLISLNLNSPVQIRKLIFDPKEDGGMGFTTTRTTPKGLMATDEKALVHLRKESKAVDALLKFRQCAKMGKWFELWSPLRNQSYDGRVHPSFIQTRIQSGRFASASPNIQNLTKHWWFQNIPGSVPKVMRNGEAGKDFWTGNARDFIVASPGYTLLSFDYKSAEIQMLAALAQEESIIDAFYSGEDFHKWTASIVFNTPINEVTKKQRQSSKAVSFGIAFGISVKALAQQLDISVKEAENIVALYFSKFPKLAAYVEQQHQLVYSEFEVRTWLGRRAVVWEAMHASRGVRNKAERKSVNVPVQGGATGDYAKIAMVNCANALKSKGWWGNEVRLLMNQHDSLVFEVHDSIPTDEIIEFLTRCVQFDLAGVTGLFDTFKKFPPMSVDWEGGYRWGSVASIEEIDMLDASELHIYLSEESSGEDLNTVMDVLATNPGDIPVTVFYNGIGTPLGMQVKAHPDVLHKVLGGDPDRGITRKPVGVTAEFIK